MRRVIALVAAMATVMAGVFVTPMAQAAGVVPPIEAGTTIWVTRGGDANRNSRVYADFGLLAPVRARELDLGESASQPINVGNRVYHLAGNNLYEIDLSRLDPTNPDPTTNPGVRVVAPNVNNCVRNGVNVCGSDGSAWSYRPSSSGLFYAAVDGVGVVYFGTGNNQICAVRLVETAGQYPPPLCYPLGGTEPISGTPLVFVMSTSSGQADVAIVGDKAGGLWAIQGLGKGGPIYWKRYNLGSAWITPSPAATGLPGEFVWGADGVGDWRGNGVYAKFRVQPADPAMGQDLTIIDHKLDPANSWFQHTGVATSGGGIADGFAVLGHYVYFADKQGDLYEVNVRTGEPRVLDWRTAFPDSDGVFINQIPSVDMNYVYFTARYTDTGVPGSTGRRGGGGVVAVKRSSWTPAWVDEAGRPRVFPVPGGGNTIPLDWAAQGLLVVGSMDGHLYGINRYSGRPAALALGPDSATGCGLLTSMNLLRVEAGEQAYRAKYDYQQLSGAGTDPVIVWQNGTDPYLLSGVNFWVDRDENHTVDEGESGGRLVAYKLRRTYNVAVDSMFVPGESDFGDVGRMDLLPMFLAFESDSDPFAGERLILDPEQTYTLRTYVTLTGMKEPSKVNVLWFYVAADLSTARLFANTPVVVAPGRRVPVEVELQPSVTGSHSGYILAVANPDGIFTMPSALQDFLSHLLLKHYESLGDEGATRAFSVSADVGETWRQAVSRNLVSVPPACAPDVTVESAVVRPEQRDAGFVEGLEDDLTAYLSHMDNFVYTPVEYKASDLVLTSAKAPSHADYNALDSYTVNFTVENKYTKPIIQIRVDCPLTATIRTESTKRDIR